MSSPRVSVLLPVRDMEATVERALASLAAQTFGDFEVLAIDDGSRDGSGALLEAWARRDARVRVLETGGEGLVAALTLALGAARGELIARMDADDESLPERFARSVAALDASPELAGVGTGVEIVRGDRPPSPNLQAYGRWLSSLTTPQLLFRDRFIEAPLCHPSVMLRADALRAAGGWRDAGVPEDWELWLRLLERGERLSCLPELLHRWSDHDARLTRSDPRYARARHLDLKADYLGRLLGDRPVTFWGATDTARGLARRLGGRGARLRRFVELDPRKVGQRVHGLPVVHLDDPSALDDAHVLVCVAAKGAREEIRAWLSARGRVELRDFTCAA